MLWSCNIGNPEYRNIWVVRIGCHFQSLVKLKELRKQLLKGRLGRSETQFAVFPLFTSVNCIVPYWNAWLYYKFWSQRQQWTVKLVCSLSVESKGNKTFNSNLGGFFYPSHYVARVLKMYVLVLELFKIIITCYCRRRYYMRSLVYAIILKIKK